MIEIRTVRDEEFEDWQRARNTGFLEGPVVESEQLEGRRATFRPERALGAFDAGRCVGTFRSFGQEVTAVGGAPVPANAVTNVTVSPTHRRRGLLTGMLRRDQDAAVERGDVVSTLIAAEYPIYGRYGFGPATWSTCWTVNVSRTGLDPRGSLPADGARIDLVDGAEVRALGPELFERLRPALPGAVSRDTAWWEAHTGVRRPEAGWTEPYHAVCRSAAGTVEGLVSYRCGSEPTGGEQMEQKLTVDKLLATSPAVEEELWRFLFSVDWVTRVVSGRRSPDDVLPFLLPDQRAAQADRHSDWLWVRILDVVRALEARTYERTGSLVLEVLDEGGPAAGRFRLDVSPEGASCTPAPGASAELTLRAGELATVWLGDGSLTRLAALGRVREDRKGAARTADALFRTATRPWCPDVF